MTKQTWGARVKGQVFGRPGQDAPWDLTTWDLFEKDAGGRVELMAFGKPAPWNEPFSPQPFENCRQRGALPLLTIDVNGATLAEVAAGKHADSIMAWGQAAAAWGGDVLLRFAWEMNGTWYAWGKEAAANPAIYGKAWDTFFGLLDLAGAKNVKSLWCPNVVFHGSTPLADLYPTREPDFLGMDGYNWGPRKGGWLSFSQVFRPTYDILRMLGPQPILICETGCTEVGGSKAGWIADMFAALPLYDIEGVSWFNVNQLDGKITWDWPIESSAAATAAFRAGIAELAS